MVQRLAVNESWRIQGFPFPSWLPAADGQCRPSLLPSHCWVSVQFALKHTERSRRAEFAWRPSQGATAQKLTFSLQTDCRSCVVFFLSRCRPVPPGELALRTKYAAHYGSYLPIFDFQVT
uniref:Uncharacterized protein n=1 Tax=Trichuris muris TaxID=70415 RepID=A0A5S6QWS4_TRIMR